jgi:hypothetical protein
MRRKVCRVTAAIALLALALWSMASPDAGHAGEPLIVVLDSWRNAQVVDEHDRLETVAFDNQLMAQFGTNPRCRAVRIIRTEKQLDFVTAVKPKHLWLTIEPAERTSKRRWEIAEAEWNKLPRNFMSGEGPAKQIAEDVCAIATKTGA